MARHLFVRGIHHPTTIARHLSPQARAVWAKRMAVPGETAYWSERAATPRYGRELALVRGTSPIVNPSTALRLYDFDNNCVLGLGCARARGQKAVFAGDVRHGRLDTGPWAYKR